MKATITIEDANVTVQYTSINVLTFCKWYKEQTGCSLTRAKEQWDVLQREIQYDKAVEREL